jgi:hypothetical protein
LVKDRDIKGYKNLPWEKEAYSGMNKYYKMFVNSKEFKDLVGQDDNLDYILSNLDEGSFLSDHKIDEKWSEKYKKSIDCNNPKGFSQKAHCAGREKRKNETTMKKVSKKQLKEVQLFLEENCPTDPSKWNYYKNQAKKKFDVYPSAYANGWAAKQYKEAGGKWKKCKK